MSEAALEAAAAVEAKLAEHGLDELRQPDQAAPEVEGTPAEEETPVEEAEAPPVEAETPEQLLAGKYKTVDDLEHAYTEAQKKISELGNTRSQTEQEMHQLRSEFEQMRGQIQQPQPMLDQATVDWFDNLAVENPQQAVAWSLQAQQPHLFDRAMNTWYETQPRQAAAFERAVERDQLRAEFQQSVQPVQQTVAAQTETAEIAQAIQNITSADERLLPLSDELPGLAERYPAVAAALKSPDFAGKQQAVEALFKIALSERTDTLTQADQQARQTETEEAQQARAQAAVASGTTSTERTTETSNIDRFRQDFRQEAKLPPLQ